jgi:hypothetical protein
VPPPFSLRFSDEARDALSQLTSSPQHAKKLKKVRKALGRLEVDPRHPGLRSHKYSSLHGQDGEDVWDSYVENNTPSAWRIFWHYGPGASVITVVSITPHP